MTKIIVVNRSTKVEDILARRWTWAVQKQVRDHFQPYYSLEANLIYISRNQKEIPEDGWKVYLNDEPPKGDEGALGYHDQDKAGRPITYVFVQYSMDCGEEPSVTLSHEILELLANPFCDQAAMGPSLKRLIVAYEACDAVQGETYLIDGIHVSNFVTPNYFGLHDPPPYDYLGNVKKPFEIRSGGYEIHAGINRRWIATDIKGQQANKHGLSRAVRYRKQSAPRNKVISLFTKGD